MDKCREEFEQWFKTTQYFCNYFTDSDLNLNHRNEYENEIINGAWLTWQHQQAKVEELQKRVDVALEKLDQRHVELWGRWKEQADMQDQGAANAFEEAYWILEQALKGEGQ